MGKSAFAMNLAINVANRNKGGEAAVAIFSLEMGSDQLVERMLASESSIRLNTIKSGRLAKNEWARFTTSCTKLGSMNLYFDDSADSSISSIRAKCRKLKADSGVDFIVIDYLQLISGSGKKNTSREQEISEISRSLKILAKELNVPVIALSQVSRTAEKRDDKRPMLSDLRESGAIEQDADVVMFLYRDEYYHPDTEKKNVGEVIIAKHRGGSTGTVELAWLPSYTKFANLEIL